MRAGLAARDRTDRLLLRWCQQSAPGEESVSTPDLLPIDPRLAEEMDCLGRSLDRLLRRFADAVLASDEAVDGFRLPAFPFAAELFAAGPLRAPFFWGRFDVFERADGGLAVLEYNCDKPAGQREIWASEALGPRRNNPNHGARERFRRALDTAWIGHCRRFGIGSRRPRLALLADPAHREEFRLAYLFGREAARLGWAWDVVGPDNLVIDAGHAAAYGECVDIVLRQYPTEFLHEVVAAPALWRASLDGRLLWLNDPRAVVAQAKSVFAHLHRLEAEDRWLTPSEAALVRRYLPLTGMASDPAWRDRARRRPEDWVIKPVLGRYSESVRVGAFCSRSEWERALAETARQPEHWVIQAYVPPRRRWLPHVSGERPGYVNWGVYLSGGDPAGICPRLQPMPLTEERTSWWAPPAVGSPPRHHVTVRKPIRALTTRQGIGRDWQAIADRQALAGYTNVWTDGMANFTLAAIELEPAAWDQLAHASLTVSRAVGRVLAHLHGRPELTASLGIPGVLASMVGTVDDPEQWSFLSRLDWALTTDGRWKLLEINSDTPAGLWECGSVAPEVARLHRGRAGHHRFWQVLAASWRRAVERALGGDADGPITIGMVASRGAAEDHDQLRAHARAIRCVLPRADFEWGAPDEIAVSRGRARLLGRPLDVLFRYYPLDWLAEPGSEPLLDLVRTGRLPMLPPAHTLIPQSKAFLALLWELVDRDFFPPAEAAAIRAHVALTRLDARRLGRTPRVVKPYLEREGLGVRFAAELTRRERRRIATADVVHQEALDLARVRLPVGTAAGWREESRVLVFGVYLAGADLAGVYTRAGDRITGREAVFVPVLLR